MILAVWPVYVAPFERVSSALAFGGRVVNFKSSIAINCWEAGHDRCSALAFGSETLDNYLWCRWNMSVGSSFLGCSFSSAADSASLLRYWVGHDCTSNHPRSLPFFVRAGGIDEKRSNRRSRFFTPLPLMLVLRPLKKEQQISRGTREIEGTAESVGRHLGEPYEQ